MFGFVAVEKRSPAPLVDLALLRNALLIGSTLGILIGAGTINGLMFVMSLFFQDPATLGLSPFEAGLATLPGDRRPRPVHAARAAGWRPSGAAAR